MILPTDFMKISKKFRISATVKRYDTVIDPNPAVFNPTPSTPTETEIQVVVSNPSSQDIKFLAMGGGMQSSEMFVFHTDFPLRKGSERDGTLADEVVFKGISYVIIDIKDYSQYAKYTRAIGAIKNV